MKLLSFALYAVAGLILWPFLLGYWLLRVIRHSVHHRLTQAALVAIVLICSLGFGSVWVGAMFSPSTYKAKDTTTETPVVAPAKEEPAVTEATTPPAPIMYDVADVVDGDTLKITDNGSLVTIRVIGIDTPETVDPRKPVQCFGKEASDQAKTLLAGKKVSLAPDPTQDDKDKYDRLLRYVTLEDGTDYGLKMLADGYAHEYTYNVPYQRQTAYKQTEKDASAADKGLWAPTLCNGDTTKAAASATPAPATTAPAPTKTTPTPKKAAAPAPATTSAPSTQTTSAPSTSTASHGDKDCKDFATHDEAQAYFDSLGGSPSNNVDDLDRDHDGLACESNP